MFWRFFGRPVAAGREIWAQKNDRNHRCFVNFSWSPPNCRSSSIRIRFLRCFDDFLCARSRTVAKFGHKKNDRNHRCFVNFLRSPTKPSIELYKNQIPVQKCFIRVSYESLLKRFCWKPKKEDYSPFWGPFCSLPMALSVLCLTRCGVVVFVR